MLLGLGYMSDTGAYLSVRLLIFKKLGNMDIDTNLEMDLELCTHIYTHI